MVQPRIRPAKDDDWQAMFGTPAPGIWSGMVAATDYVIYGLGGVYCARDGRWWITFERWPGAGRVKLAHQAAKELLACAREAEIVVHALADPDIAGSEMWIRNLGFEQTDERIGGLPVWVRK